MTFFVYIMTSRKHGTLYTGHTDDLARRVHEHREGMIAGFTKTHGLKRLVYYEQAETREAAREREVQLKKWRRPWKIALIEENNPNWLDLYDDLV